MKFLRNRKTGVIFPDHPKLRENKNMEPCNADGQSAFETVEVAVSAAPNPAEPDPGAPSAPALSTNGIVLSRATKAELIKFAFDNFGVQLEDNQTAVQLRDQVKTLIENDN